MYMMKKGDSYVYIVRYGRYISYRGASWTYITIYVGNTNNCIVILTGYNHDITFHT